MSENNDISGKRDTQNKGGRPRRTSDDRTATLQKVLSERLREIRSTLAKSQPEMDKLLDLGVRSWQRYESGGQLPGSQVIHALVENGWNANWILVGEGPRKLHEMDSAPGAVVSAGPDNQGPVAALSLGSQWLESRGIAADNVAVAVFPDDSMAGSIEKGDLVMADTSRAELKANGLYMIEHARQRTAVRLYLNPDGSVTRIMDNSKYPSPRIDREEIEPYIIGTVFWIGGER